jgi:hypothetical protein
MKEYFRGVFKKLLEVITKKKKLYKSHPWIEPEARVDESVLRREHVLLVQSTVVVVYYFPDENPPG